MKVVAYWIEYLLQLHIVTARVINSESDLPSASARQGCNIIGAFETLGHFLKAFPVDSTQFLGLVDHFSDQRTIAGGWLFTIIAIILILSVQVV